MRRGTSEYSEVYLSNYLGLAWPSALVGGMPMRRTLYFKPCACLLVNRAYEDTESHRLWRQGGDVLEPREYGLPNMGVSGRFLQPLCSSVVLGPPVPLIMHAGWTTWWIKGCESFLHLNHQLRKYCSTKFSHTTTRYHTLPHTTTLTGVRAPSAPSHLLVSSEHFLLAMFLLGSLNCYVCYVLNKDYRSCVKSVQFLVKLVAGTWRS